jgi:hypothetical protein
MTPKPGLTFYVLTEEPLIIFSTIPTSITFACPISGTAT